MRTIQTTARPDPEGILHLDLAVGLASSEYDVVVILQPRTAETSQARSTPQRTDGEGPPEEAPPLLDEKGWPVGFFEEVAGQWKGEFIRDQGVAEIRDDF